MTSALLQALDDCPVVAILRAPVGNHLDVVIDTLVDAGIRALEVTLPTPGALSAVRRATARHGHTVAVGAGTVMTEEQVDRAAEAGALFVVSPNTDPAVVGAASAREMASLPGAFTPTEVCAAVAAGATAVKIFPARSLGPSYLGDLLAPLPDLRLIPVGGVEHGDVAGYLDAGAIAVGVGSPLVGTALLDGDIAALADRARRFVRAAQRQTAS